MRHTEPLGHRQQPKVSKNTTCFIQGVPDRATRTALNPAHGKEWVGTVLDPQSWCWVRTAATALWTPPDCSLVDASVEQSKGTLFLESSKKSVALLQVTVGDSSPRGTAAALSCKVTWSHSQAGCPWTPFPLSQLLQILSAPIVSRQDARPPGWRVGLKRLWLFLAYQKNWTLWICSHSP